MKPLQEGRVVPRELVTLDAIRRAGEHLEEIAQRTPVDASQAISSAAGERTLLKMEHLQRTGSFKIRGAANRIRRLTPDERARGVVCASAGNHAQGVALSAMLTGTPSAVFMPQGAPLPKVQATQAYGAQVHLTGETFNDAFAASQEWAAEHDATFVHPFDHPEVIAGQGTLGIEIVEQVPDVGSVVVPIGGGGLIAGVAAAVKALKPDTKIVGVQAAGAAAVPRSLESGEVVTLPEVATIADGIAVKHPGVLTLAHIDSLVDEVVTVTDEQIARAVLLLVERAKQVVEPAGAASVAAVMSRPTNLPGPVVVLLSGGNVDPQLLVRILESGLGEEGRYVVLRTQLDDQPGALSRLLAAVAECGANVYAVQHHRFGSRMDLQRVEVQLEVETRGPDHISAVIKTLTGQGYRVAEAATGP